MQNDHFPKKIQKIVHPQFGQKRLIQELVNARSKLGEQFHFGLNGFLRSDCCGRLPETLTGRNLSIIFKTNKSKYATKVSYPNLRILNALSALFQAPGLNPVMKFCSRSQHSFESGLAHGKNPSSGLAIPVIIKSLFCDPSSNRNRPILSIHLTKA